VARLEELTRDALVRGVGNGDVSVVDVRWIGSNTIELTYKDTAGRLGSELVYREDEPRLEIVAAGRPWSFDGDGDDFRLVAEAQRISLACLSVSRTHVLTALDVPDQFILAFVPVAGDRAGVLRYVWQPFRKEPDWGAVSVNYELGELLARLEEPR
jgi:hypothetical protein